MTDPSAQTRMKALVVSRLLLGDIKDWKTFQRERETAGKITNRHAARSVSSQIGRTYRDLSAETRKFIANNFLACDDENLARLCDSIEVGIGLYLRLDEFETAFFSLADQVKRRVPFYAHVSISTYGLQFEYPEHHFICDLEAGFEGLKETRQRIRELPASETALKAKRDDVASLVGREKFISRSMVSASFSLVEAFLSGLFFTAINRSTLGALRCDEALLRYAQNKESAPLKDRIDRIVKFASGGRSDSRSEPFKSFMDVGKRYRDAIHHTTPFERKDIEAGQRLLALYEIKPDVALLCTILAFDSVLKISNWLYGDEDSSAIAANCKELLEKVMTYSVDEGFAEPS
ncbi:MAG TPA: hypothetical protein VNF99_18985 [Stellaceae bacterium]|nr:hypothetical protein [Stellaceae bacterium]